MTFAKSARLSSRFIVSRARANSASDREFLMGIEYVYDITVVAVIADWTIEMVKRGLGRQASRSFGQARK